MSWLSSWWDKASGANQKVDPNKLGGQYDTAMQGVNAGYDKISGYAEGMMDPNSQQNQQQRSMMNQQGADAAAQSSRMAGRNAAMAGGAPAGALAAQTASTANQSLAGSNNAFNQYLQGAQGQGASMLSGVLANQGQMQNQKFNMMQNQRQANAQADTQGAQFGANLLGSAIGMIPGLQEGGMAYDNIDHHISYDSYQNGAPLPPQEEIDAMKPNADRYTDWRRDEHPTDRLDARHPGEEYGEVYQRPMPAIPVDQLPGGQDDMDRWQQRNREEDGKQHYFLGGLAASVGIGALKKGYDSLEGDNLGDKMGNIKGNLGKLGEGIQEGVSEMKQQAGDQDYHRTEQEARDAATDQFFASPEGLEAEATFRGQGTSDEDFDAANVGKIEGDAGYQTRKQVGDARVQAGMDKYSQDYDIKGGEHRVGATRARLEDFRNNEGVKTVGKGIAGTYGLAKAGVGVGKDAIVGGTGLLAGAVGTGAGAVGAGAMTAGKAIKKDWQKEKGSIGKGLLSGASQLLKEVGSPGYLRGKEMAKIANPLKLKKVDVVTKEPTKQPKLVSPTQQEGDQASLVEPSETAKRVAQPTDDNRVEVDGQKVIPDVILSKVKSTNDLANLDPEQIKGVQASLKAAGYDMTSSEVDGVMDGKAGPDTMKMMQEYLEKQGKQQGGYMQGYQEGGEAKDESTFGQRFVKRFPSQHEDPDRASGQERGLTSLIDFLIPQTKLDVALSALPIGALGKVGKKGIKKLIKGKRSPYNEGRTNVDMQEYRDWPEELKKGDILEETLSPKRPDLGDVYDDEGLPLDLVDTIKRQGMQEGGTVWNPAKPPSSNEGMLSRVMGPRGEMNIKTRMGGFKVG